MRCVHRLSSVSTRGSAPPSSAPLASSIALRITVPGLATGHRESNANRNSGNADEVCGIDKWLASFADPVRAQSAIDRSTNNADGLVIEGATYRKRLKPGMKPTGKAGQRQEK